MTDIETKVDTAAKADLTAVKTDAVSDFDRIKKVIESEDLVAKNYVKAHMVYVVGGAALILGFLAGHFIR